MARIDIDGGVAELTLDDDGYHADITRGDETFAFTLRCSEEQARGSLAATLQFEEVDALFELLNVPADSPPKPRRYVVVRCRQAGVHVGYLSHRGERTLTLTEGRRIWSWEGANTLHEIADKGCAIGSKVSVTCARVELSSHDVYEVIDCTEVARISIEGLSWGS